jgi:hypothetical protein
MKKRNSVLKTICFLLTTTFLFSCANQKKIEFIKNPEVVDNPNKSALLTCFIDFKTKSEYDKVTFLIKDSSRDTKLAYSYSDKQQSGYLIMLMRPDTEQSISIEITDKNGKVHQLQNALKYKTPALPTSDAEFPKIQITIPYSKTPTEELTLFNPRRRAPVSTVGANEFNKSFGMLVIVNQKGEVLWYYKTNSRISDFDMLSNGNISYMTQDSKVVEIDFAGNIIQQWYAANRPDGPDENATPVDALTFHHDASHLPNGNRLVLSTEVREFDNYFTSVWDENAPRKKQKVMGDIALEFTPQGEIVHQWNTFDYLPLSRIGYDTFNRYWVRRGFPDVTVDWSHANAIVPVPNEEAYLVNFRQQSAMIKINKATSEIEWIFAEPTGWGEALQDKLLNIPTDGWNWHQHSPRFTSNGNLLFFNNNNYQVRPFDKPKKMIESPSHVVEYKIDEKEKAVKKVWTSEIPGEVPIVSTAMGRVSELPKTGNILACFGALVSQEHLNEMTWQSRGKYPQWTLVREYKHTTPAEIVWEMRLLPLNEDSQIGWTLFGAERVEIMNGR